MDSVNLLQRFQKKAKAPRLVPVIRRRSENGDTLIEVLVSLTVLGTASVALLVALGTVISASAEHRNLTNNDLALETAAQEITAQMQTNSSYFLTACPENLANYPYNSGSPAFTVTEGSKTIPISYGYGTNTAVQFWGTAKNTVNNPSNINTFNPNNLCQDSVPQMITIQVTGTTDVLSFVVDNTFGSTGDSAAGTAAQLVIANSPGTLYAPPNSAGTSGTVLNFQPVIEVADSNGNTVLTDLSPVQILLYPVSGSGAVSGCSGLESQGYVTFTNCTISSAGTYDICATDNSINASPTDPTFNGGVPTGSISLDGSTAFCNNAQGGVVQIIVTGGGSFLVFTVSPVGGQSGTPLTTEPTITDENSSGTPISVGTNAVTVTVTASGGQLATSTGCTTATIPANGNSVTLSGCNFSGGYQLVSQGKYQATQYVLIASATGITTGVSGAFGVSDYGFVTQVSFYTQPIGVAAGTQAVPAANTPFATQSVTIPFVTTTNAQAVVALRDAFGNVVGNGYNNSSSTQPDGITGGISAGETLGCSGAETFNSGYYIITGFCGSAYMNNVTFSAQATVSNVGVTPVKVSNPFNITYVASSLTFTTQPVLAASGTSFSTMPVVSISDWQNSPVTAATASTLNLSFTPKTPSNASLTLCTNLTPLAGVVDVENCVFGGSETTTYDLTASITVGGVTLGPVNSSGFSPTLPGAATQLVFSSATPVVAGVAGAVLTTQPIFDVEDAWGNLVNTSAAVISISSSGGTLSGCSSLAATGGVVTVQGCALGGLVNTSFYLTASSGSLNPANTNSFDLAGPGPTSQIILNIASCQQSIQWQGTCTAGATLEDAYTNVATGDQSPVTFNFTGTGSVSQSGFTQNAGQASETLTGNTLGPVNVTASAEGISSNSASFTVVGKNQAITWSAPGTQTWGSGSSGVTLGGSGPLGGTSASFAGTGGSSIYTKNPFNNPMAFSTSLWFKTSTPGAIAGGTTEQSSVTVTHWDRNLWIDQAGHLVWAINDNSGALDEVSSPGVYDDGTWHQIVATYGLAGEFLYVDGALVASNVNATAGQNYPMYWHLGYAQMLGWPDANVSDYFQGSLAQAALYTTQLSQANVTALYGAATTAAESTQIQTYSPVSYWPLTDATGTTVFTDQSGNSNTGYVEGVFSLGSATDTGSTTVTFASSTPTVCTVNGNLVTTVAIGTCTITPTASAGGTYASTPGTPVNITINPTNQTFTWSNLASENWVPGGTGTFSLALVTDSAGTQPTFSSSTTGVCTVSGTTVTMVAAGTCTITPSEPAGGNYLATTGFAENITINAASQTINWNPPASETWTTGGTGTFTLTASDSAGTTVTFASSTGTVCTVSGTTVTMLLPGTCTITATAPAGGSYLLTTGSPVNITINPGVQTITWTPPGTQTWVVGGAGTFPLGTASDTAGTTVTFASSTGTVCTVSGTNVTMLTAGTCTITATATAGGNYAATSGSPVNITINGASQTITWTPPGTQTWVVGGAGTFPLGTASDSAGTTVTFASSTGTVCTVSGTNVTMLTAGTCTITATAPAGGNYAATSGSPVNITINKIAQTITITSSAPTRARSGGPTYTITATSSSGLTVAFTLDGSSTGCSLAGSVVTFTAAGTCRIDANQAGNVDYNGATQVQQVITVVTLGFTQIAGNTGTGSLATASFSATSGTPVLVFVSYQASATTRTCAAPSGASLGTFTAIGTTSAWNTSSGSFLDCAYSAVATGTAGVITANFTGTGTFTRGTIQIVSVTGDASVVLTNSAYNSGNSTGPVFKLGATPGSDSSEVLFGTANFPNGGTPTYTTPTGYTALTPIETFTNPNPGLVSYAYYLGGTTAASSSVTTTISYSDPWGTIGIEVQP